MELARVVSGGGIYFHGRDFLSRCGRSYKGPDLGCESERRCVGNLLDLNRAGTTFGFDKVAYFAIHLVND